MAPSTFFPAGTSPLPIVTVPSDPRSIDGTCTLYVHVHDAYFGNPPCLSRCSLRPMFDSMDAAYLTKFNYYLAYGRASLYSPDNKKE